MATESKTVWDKIQYCDPRILYALFAVVLIVFEVSRPKLPVTVTQPVQMLYDVIERLPDDKIVLLDCDLAAGIRAECLGQYESVIRHLFSRGIKFAVINWTQNPEGQKFGVQVTEEIALEMSKTYGEDYCVLQALTQSGGATIQALAKDIPGIAKAAVNKTPLQDVPMMKDVRDIHDVSLVFRVGYTWDFPPWIGVVQSAYGTPYASGCVGISTSTAYPFIDSGQICGMLPGAAGAAAYEYLMVRDGIAKKKGMGTETVSVQSFATLYVAVAIILGNLAMVGAKLHAKKGV